MLRLVIPLLLILLLLDSCSPVRSKNSRRVAVGKGQYPTGSVDTSGGMMIQQPRNFFEKVRFDDTTTVVAEIQDKPREKTISDMLDEAINEFDNEQYDVACPKFDQFLETFMPGDSLYYETAFMICECHVARNELQEAHDFLSKMNNMSDVPLIIKQKVLVRLGHIKCVQGDKAGANFLFEELKRDYPNSMYLRLATCEALE
mgnify:CR=1 FL=1